jgi:flagellar motility protein MotE (MotC chaperone)
MTIRRENGRMGGLILGAATGLATIFAAVPQHARAQGWQTEIAGSVKKPTMLPAPAHKMSGVPGRSIPKAGDGGAFKSEPVKVAVPTDDAPLSLLPPSTSARPAKRRGSSEAATKPTPPATRQEGADKAQTGIESAKAVVVTPLTEAGDGAPAMAASEDKAAPSVAGMSIAPPVAAHELPEAAALGAMVPTVAEPGKAEAADTQPKAAGRGKDDKVPVLASPPPAAPVPSLPPVTGRNHTIAIKSRPAAAPPAEPAQAVATAPAATDAEEPPVLITSAVETGPAQNGAGSGWSTSTAESVEANAPGPGKEADEPVFITSAARDRAPEPQIAAKTAEKPRGKRAAEAQKPAAKARPSKPKPDAAPASAAASPAGGWNAPIVASSTAAKPNASEEAELKPGQQKPAGPSEATPVLAAMAPIGAETEKTSQPTQAATSTAAVVTAAGTPLPPGPSAASPGRDSAPSPQAGVPASAPPEEEAEPDDPFVDVQLTQTRGQGEALTTQVVPTNTPPDATSQITPADRNPAGQYCSNIADPAIDARIAWQRQNLEAAEKQITERTRELEAKTAEYQRWLDRRDAFAEKAKKTVVDIYTKMKPDAAALQLQAMDEETAAAVLVKLDARSASAVMNEMDPEKAARLSSIISAAGKGPNLRGRPAQSGTGNRS